MVRGILGETRVDTKKKSEKTVGRSKLSYDELQTILLEIELILNPRPLCYLYDDDQEDILTPNHLLYGRNLKLINYRDSYEINVNLSDGYFSKRMQYINRVIKHFWNRWRKDYVLALRDNLRYKKNSCVTTPAVNVVVLVHDDKQPTGLPLLYFLYLLYFWPFCVFCLYSPIFCHFLLYFAIFSYILLYFAIFSYILLYL